MQIRSNSLGNETKWHTLTLSILGRVQDQNQWARWWNMTPRLITVWSETRNTKHLTPTLNRSNINGMLTVQQGCINRGARVVLTTKFCPVASNICGSSLWNLLHVTPLTPRNFKGVIRFFWKICEPLSVSIYFNSRFLSLREAGGPSFLKIQTSAFITKDLTICLHFQNHRKTKWAMYL